MTTASAEIRSWAVPTGGHVDINRRSEFFRLVQSAADVDIELFVGGRRVGHFQAVPQGIAVRQTFDLARIKSTAGSSQTIVVALTDDVRVDVLDNRPTVNATVNATVEPSSVLVAEPDVTVPNTSAVTQLVAADVDRKEVIISSDSSQPGAVRLGDSGMAAGEGYVLEPGGSVALGIEGAVHARHPGGFGDVDLNITTLRRP